jgi:hypothetical protein
LLLDSTNFSIKYIFIDMLCTGGVVATIAISLPRQQIKGCTSDSNLSDALQEDNAVDAVACLLFPWA